MTLLSNKLLLTVLGLCVFGLGNAHANSCSEDSPLKQQLGDNYDEHDMGYVLREINTNNPQSKTGQEDLAFIDSLSKRSFKKGTGVRYQCKGVGERSHIETTEFTLDDVELITSNNGSFSIKAWENSDRKIKASTMSIAPPKLWQKNQDGEATNVIVTRVENPYLNTDGGLLGSNYYYLNGYVYKPADYERENLLDHPDRSGYRLTEIRTIIQPSRKGLTLTQSIFINGERAEWVIWNLRS